MTFGIPPNENDNSGAANAQNQIDANNSLSSIDNKLSGTLQVNVVNQIDLTTITAYLLDIKQSCADIDANTDTVEQALADIVTAINSNGTVNHADLLNVISQLQAVDANTDGQELLLSNILNKLIASPATLAEQQTQTTALNAVNTNLGTDGATPPTIAGTGIRGWLRAIYERLVAALPNMVTNRVPVLAQQYLTEVARGNIPGEGKIELRGYDKSSNTSYEPIWSESTAAYPQPTTAQTLTVSSTSANDTNSAGTGARQLLVKYVQFSDLAEVTTVVNLNGQTAVTVSSDCYAVNELRVTSVGSTNSNVGTIYAGYGTVTAGVPANKLATIDETTNVSQQLIYTVPANKVAEIHSYGVTTSKLCYIQFRIRPSKLSPLTYIEYDLPVNGVAPTPLLSVPIEISAGQQFMGYAASSGGTALVGMTMRGVLRSV